LAVYRILHGDSPFRNADKHRVLDQRQRNVECALYTVRTVNFRTFKDFGADGGNRGKDDHHVVSDILVPVAMFVFTVFVPLVTALVYSFYEWKGGPQKTFTGLTNYITLFHDGTFWQAFGHNIYLYWL